MSLDSRAPNIWVRALILCDDVRFELGGTTTLVGVYGDRIVVAATDGELVIPRLVIYSVVAGLTGATEITWRHTLRQQDREFGDVIAHGHEPHDATADEHRFVNIVSPLWLPEAGSYRLAVDFETSQAFRTVEHQVIVERAPAQ